MTCLASTPRCYCGVFMRQLLYKALRTCPHLLSAIWTTLRQRGKEPKRFYPQESSTSNQAAASTDSTGERQQQIVSLFLLLSFSFPFPLSSYSLSLFHPIPIPRSSTTSFSNSSLLPPLTLDTSHLCIHTAMTLATPHSRILTGSFV